MKLALPESIALYNSIFSDKQKKNIQQILNEIYMKVDSYSTNLLWEVDKEIGGIGGYCMPCDPKKILFQVVNIENYLDLYNMHVQRLM